MRRGFTYKEIIDYVKTHYNYTVQTCIIAAVLREFGYEVGKVANSGTAKEPKVPTDRDCKAIREAIDFIEKH